MTGEQIYFILDLHTHETLAMTDREEIANQIAEVLGKTREVEVTHTDNWYH